MKRRFGSFLRIALLIVALDQITKFLFKDVSWGIFNYTTNTGAAFSLFQGYTLILTIISFVVAILLIYFAKKYLKYYLGLAFIFAGTVGNLIDRVILGFVRDFVDFGFFPVFNVADTFNVVGVIVVIWMMYKR